MGLNYMGVAAINVVPALLSIPVIAAGIWLSTQADNACVQILQWPVIALGVAVLAVGLAGFVAAFWRLPWLLLADLVTMFVVVVALACLAVFIFAVTMGSSGHRVPSREFLEYDLDDYSAFRSVASST
ncbi:protein TORNADO 2-like [Miscanthus floridulus]|uniref:protein TORNADO 2-like n=1 Tax=Miscanthus floridulus TaxID=154761 RepID=UPI00345A5A4B